MHEGNEKGPFLALGSISHDGNDFGSHVYWPGIVPS